MCRLSFWTWTFCPTCLVFLIQLYTELYSPQPPHETLEAATLSAAVSFCIQHNCGAEMEPPDSGKWKKTHYDSEKKEQMGRKQERLLNDAL